MTKATAVPISGEVLKWAIRESGLTEKQIADKLEVLLGLVREWETGSAFPTKTQFSRLVEILKRPSSVFFLPEPPARRLQYANFRKAPGGEEATLTPEEARWIREARRIQEATALVLERLGRGSVDLPHLSTGANPETTAQAVRDRLGISFDAQASWSNASVALREWRTALENRSVLVFLLRLGRSSCRGFSLWDDRAPLIVSNTAYNQQARIYTIFHEYGHLLTRTNSLCVDFQGPVRSVDALERWCESFAADFLLPRHEFLEYLDSISPEVGRVIKDFHVVARLANRFKVSLRAIALRLIELGRADQELYSEVDSKARVSEKERHGGGGRGLKSHERRIEEYGRRVPAVFLEGVRKDVIGTYDILDYLDLSTGTLDELKKVLVGE